MFPYLDLPEGSMRLAHPLSENLNFERAGRKTHIFLQVEACVGDERHEKDTALLPRGVARAEKGVPTLHRVVNTLW